MGRLQVEAVLDGELEPFIHSYLRHINSKDTGVT